MNRTRSTLALLLLLLLGACAPARRAPAASLSPDSAALLRRAVQLARPAYATQQEAVRAGVYRQAEPRGVLAATQAPEAAPPRPAPSAAAGAPLARFVVQIATYRDARAAELAARDARLTFPSLPVEVTQGEGGHRVALGGWPTASAAEARLEEIRRLFPGAQIRPAAAP